MPVPRGATDLSPNADWDAVVTACSSLLRTSFNTENNPKATPPRMAQSIWGYGVSLHQAHGPAWEQKGKNQETDFSSCITADISPCSYKTPPRRIPQPWLPGSCDLHIPGILMIVVLWDLLKSCQKVTDKPVLSAAQEQDFTHCHCTWLWSLGPALPFPRTISLLLLWITRAMWFQALKSKMSDRLTQGHSSSSAPWQLLQDDLHPPLQTSSHLYSQPILSGSSQNLALPWTNKKLRKITTLKCHQHSRESPF